VDRIADTPNLRLVVASSAESVVLVRQAISGLAEAIGLGRLELGEVNTAVSEACNNVVLHAYGGAEGPLEVDMCGCPGAVRMVVRDHGRGMPAGGAHAAAQFTADGIGLPVIHALADVVELGETVGQGVELDGAAGTEMDGAAGAEMGGRGTEVRMEFATAYPHALHPPLHDDGLDPAILSSAQSGDTAGLAIAPARLARTVLPRVLSALAARASFSTDRISDTQVLADALVAHTDDSLSSSHLNVGVTIAPRELHMRVGPLHAGHTAALVDDPAIGGLGSVLRRLADGHRVAAAAGAEMLVLRMAEQR
jgi:serine/threonine-protein kinase RsbW